ncbi:MAG: sugar ABC transporter permease [Endomicrobiales bacterium]|nr:sugar ABC transporter permease [Endomicrobiales bacterium]
MFNFRKYSFWFCFPSLLIIAGIALYPVLHSFLLSFFKFNLHENVIRFNGLGNYKDLLIDTRTREAFYHTFLFTISSVSIELVLGLLLALFLQRKFIGRGLTRAFSLVPWAVPTVVAALLWRWIFNDRFGLLNELLFRFEFIDTPVAFLSSSWLARLSVIIAEVWKTTPFIALLLLAGLEMIPQELYESGKIDGANAWQRFSNITLPLLKPVILISLLFRTMDALRIFDTVYVLTGGGPGNATETLSLYTYKTMFSHLQIGLGSTLAVLTFLTVTFVSAIYLLILKRSAN